MNRHLELIKTKYDRKIINTIDGIVDAKKRRCMKKRKNEECPFFAIFYVIIETAELPNHNDYNIMC